MASTPKGIIYPSDPSAQADLITDLETMAESIDGAFDGYQPKIDSTHKISADNVDDTGTTHKFITEEQRTQIIDTKNALNTGTFIYEQEWTPGITDGNIGSEVSYKTTGAFATRYKYLVFTPTVDLTCLIDEDYKFTIRLLDNTNVITARINNITNIYNFLKGQRYAINVEAIDGSTISSLDMNDYIFFTEYTKLYNTFVLSNSIENSTQSGFLVLNKEWTKGGWNATVGSAIQENNTAIFLQREKRIIINVNRELSINLKAGYKLAIFNLDNNNIVLRRLSDCYNFCTLTNGIYAISIQKTNQTAIEQENIADCCILSFRTFEPKPIPYLYNKETTLTEIHIGDTTRRVQGGCIHGNYAYYAQPATTETNDTKLVKYDLVNNQIVLTKEEHSYGHAGSMTYNSSNDTLVIINYSSGTTTFYIVDASSLEYVTEYTKSMTAYAISYDEKDGNYWINSLNSDLFFFAKIDTNFEPIYNIPPLHQYPYGGQDFIFKNNFFYIGYSEYTAGITPIVFRSAIFVFDKNGNYVGCHTLETNEEIQWCDVDDNGNLYAMVDRSSQLFKVNRKIEYLL